MNPQHRFRWRAPGWHLTYKGHISPQALLQRLASISSVKVVCTSIVHEASDAEAPYDHTHFAWLYERPIDLVGADIMDIFHNTGTVHPNIETQKSLAWMERLFVRYHAGHKTGTDGKPKFVEPVALWQQMPQCFDWGEYINTEVSEASDLLGGVCAAGIRAKTVSDVHLLQKYKRPAPYDHNYARNTFNPQILPAAFVTRQVGSLQIYGAPNLGKSEWACSQFDNPLLVTSRDMLRKFRPKVHDGIVLDKMTFENWLVTDAEQLLEYYQDVQITCRYGIAEIPKRTAKIIVTNPRDVWPADPLGTLVGRRLAQFEVVARMY